MKVLDFGLAKFGVVKSAAGGSGPFLGRNVSEIETKTEPITEFGSILGTIHYMSPEQAEGNAADQRSDIFSLGAVLYEMLTGRHAFDGDSKTAIVAAILKDQPLPSTSSSRACRGPWTAWRGSAWKRIPRTAGIRRTTSSRHWN